MKKKKKLIIMFIILAIVGALCSGAVLVIHRLYCNQLNLLKAYQKQEMPEIVCIGDSLTHGTDGYAYPTVLSEKMMEDHIYSNVVNLGVGGENTVTIAGRMGAIPFRLDEFLIPADTTPVEVHFFESEEKPVRPMIQGDTGINPCLINDVEGRLYSEKEDDGSYTYYFVRSEIGTEEYVTAGTEVVTYAQNRYKDGIYIIFMGENHGFNDIEDLIAQQKAILSLQAVNSGKYLIIGLTSGTAEERRELEEKMVETYGEHYINLREYMSTVGPETAGVSVTDTDKQQMEQGIVPDCLRVDGVHYTKEGYELLATLVYERLQSLGYFENIKEITEQYSSLWKSICW